MDRERAYSAAVSTIVRGPRSVWLPSSLTIFLWWRGVSVGAGRRWFACCMGCVCASCVFFFLVCCLGVGFVGVCILRGRPHSGGGAVLVLCLVWCLLCNLFSFRVLASAVLFSHWNDTPGDCPLPPRPRYTPCWVAPLTLLLPPTFHGRGCSMGVRPLPLLGGHPRPRPPCPRALTRLACCFRSFVAAAILAPAGAPHSWAPPSQPAHTSVGGRQRPRVVCFCSAVAATVAAVVLLLVLGFL